MNKKFLTSAIALASMFVVSQQASATVVIDNFSNAPVAFQSLEAVGVPVVSVSSLLNTSTVIGGQRDLFAEKISGFNAVQRVRARVNPAGSGLFRFQTDRSNGRAVITYDGVDGDATPSGTVYNGLGSKSFTGEMFLELIVTFSNGVGGPVHATFWDANDLSGATFAMTTFNVPGGIPSASNVSLTVDLIAANFAVVGDTFANIMDSVGAIQLEVDATATAQENWDADFTLFRSVPEPATLSMLGLGIAGVAFAGRRRKSA